MFHLWNSARREAVSHTSRQRRRRFLPSVLGSASCLEERVVPAGGQATNFAQLAQSLANTHAAQVVNSLFQSILMTNPTDTQLVQDVRRLQQGTMTANGLRNQLFASAQRQQLLSALNINVNARPRAFVNSLFMNILNQTPTASAALPFVRAINAGANPQFVAQRFLNTASASGRTITIGSPITTTPISVGGTSTTSTGTTTAVTPPLGQLPLSQLLLSQLAINPVTMVHSAINASPVASPIPQTFTPANPAPVASPIPTTVVSTFGVPVNTSTIGTTTVPFFTIA
jgi:hypothetical protein